MNVQFSELLQLFLKLLLHPKQRPAHFINKRMGLNET